jgi:hypothetical protein
MSRSHAIARNIEESIEVDFDPVAREIVLRTRSHLFAKAERKQQDILKRLKVEEIDIVSRNVAHAFARKKMGLLQLALLAKRELGMLVVRHTVPRFRASLLSSPKGVGPVEYFARYYAELFDRFGLPANAINVLDPNLHFHLKRRGEFNQISSVRTDTSTRPSQRESALPVR